MSDSSINRENVWRLSIRPVRDGLIIGLALFIVALLGILTTHQRGAAAYENEVHGHLLDMARAAASTIDIEAHEQLHSAEQAGSELHQRNIAPLYAMLEHVSGVRYIYTMKLIDGQVHFILDTPSPFEPNEDVAQIMELYEDVDPEMLAALRSGEEMVTREFYSDEWGTFMSAYVPLTHQGEHVGILGIDMTTSEYLTRLAEMRRAMVFSIAIAFMLSTLGGAAGGWIRRCLQAERSQRDELIDELRRREAELHKLSMVASRTHNGVVIADPEGRIEWVNAGFTNISGYELADVRGKKPGQALQGPRTDPATVARISQNLREGSGFQTEIINYAKDGREYWAAIDIQPVRDEAGRVINFIGVEADISERKRIENAFQHSEQHLRALLDTSPACVKVVAPDGTLREMNAAGLELVEAGDASEVVGQSVFDLVAKEHRDAFIEFHSRVCHGEEARLEFEIIGLSGTRRWMVSHAAPLIDPDTGVTEHLAVTLDITDRKRSERELIERRERFELMNMATRDVMWDYDPETDQMWWSENLRTCFGYDPESVDSSFDWWASIVHPDDHARTVQSIQDVFAGTERYWTAEYRLRRADGSYAHVLDRAYIIRDESGQPTRAVGAIADLTEQKQTSEKIAFQKTLLECQAEASPDGILVVDSTRRVISHNRRFACMWGIPDDLLATGDDKLLIQSVLDNVVDPVAFVERTDELMNNPDINATDEVRLSDGRTFDRYSTAIRTNDGTTYGRIWFFRDVTEKKRHEQELEDHKLVVENSNAVLFRWRNEDGWPVELVSENIAQFGYTADELLGGDVKFARMVHPDDLDRVAAEVRQYAEEDADDFEQEYRLICRDGTVRWIYDRTVVERDDAGEATHFQGIVIDITERKSNEARMQRLLRDLEERNKENMTLIRTLSLMHDQNNTVAETLQAIAESLPDGFQHSGVTSACIRVGEDEYRSPQYQEDELKLHADFECPGGEGGWVEVVIVDPDQLPEPSRPFIEEERQLLRTIAELLRSYLDRQRIEAENRQHKIVVENSNTLLFRWRVAEGWPVELVSENISQFGYTQQDMLDGSTTFASIVHPDDRRRVEQEVMDCYNNDIDALTQEYRLLCRDGSVRWVYDRTTAERDAEGRITHYQGIVIDVTERKEAEAKLHRLLAIIEHTPDLVGIATAELEPIYINPAGRAMLQIGPNESIDSTRITDFSAEWSADLLENVAIPAARHSGVWVGETAFLREDGRELPVSQVIIAHKDADGNVEYYSTVARDTSRQKRIEAEIRRSQQFLRSTLDALSAHIAIIDSEGRIIEVNEAWRAFAVDNNLESRHFGIGSNYITTCDQSTGDCAAEANDVADGIRRILRGEIDQFELEYPCHSSEQKQWYMLRATHFAAHGERYAVVAHENVTSRKLAIDELERARDAAESASRAKSDFLANMSHEIRTPMTAMLGYADLMMDSTLDESERRQYLEVVHRNGNHLLTVINDILDLSKIESGKLTVECVPASPVAVVSDAVSLMRSRAIEKNLALDMEFPTDLPRSIQTDPVRLRQILLNVIGNGIKFTKTGGVRVVTRFEPAEEAACGGQLIIEIHDTGIGLTLEQIERLFQPFTQADTSVTRRFGGTGLGLAISRRLAQLLGGEIDITSAGEGGSVFTLRLPVPSDAAGDLHRPGTEAIDQSNTSARQRALPRIPCRILLAEDGPDNQRLISFLLRKAGAEVTIVDDGQAAYNAAVDAEAAGKPFDMILMDMQMPVMDGYTATSRLREEGYTGLIVALTAHAMASDRGKCLDAGCDDYLTKPIDRPTLVKAVHHHVYGRDMAA